MTRAVQVNSKRAHSQVLPGTVCNRKVNDSRWCGPSASADDEPTLNESSTRVTRKKLLAGVGIINVGQTCRHSSSSSQPLGEPALFSVAQGVPWR